MNVQDIIENSDPEEHSNILWRLRTQFESTLQPPASEVIAELPTSFPPTSNDTQTLLESLGWTNVKDYGAVGDGDSDDTIAIETAISVLPTTGGVLYFPPGIYLTSGGFTLSTPCVVLGMGSGNENANAVSEIRCNSATAVLFTVTTAKCLFQGLNLVNNAGSTPSAGSAIKAAGASYLQKVNYVDVSAYGFYINYDVQVGFRWLMDHCYSHASVLYGLKVQNTLNNYRGGWIVSNCYFTAGLRNSNAAIRVESGNGGKIVNSNVNCGEDLYSFNHGVDVAPGAANLQSLAVMNCDIVNVRGNPIHIDATGGNTWDLIFISNTTFIVDTTAVPSANSPISISAATIGDVDSVTISSCIFSGRSTTPAIVLTKVDKAEIVANVNENMSTLVSQTSCTNIIIIDPGTSVAAETSYGLSSSVGTSSYLAREDHSHGTPSLSTATPQDIGSAGAAGSGSTPSKNDHVHKGVASVNGQYGDVIVGGAGQVVGLARWVSSGGTTFTLPDVAEYVLDVSDNGSEVDPLLYSLSSDHTQIVFDSAVTAGHVVTSKFVLAQV